MNKMNIKYIINYLLIMIFISLVLVVILNAQIHRFGEIYINSEHYGNSLTQPKSITFSKDGNYVYVGGYNVIAVFNRDTMTGKLNYVGKMDTTIQGLHIMNYVNSLKITSDDNYLYCANGIQDVVTVFSRNIMTGRLSFIEYKQDNEDGVDGLKGANSLIISPDNTNVYVAGGSDSAIVIFDRDLDSGILTFYDIVENSDDNVGGIVRPNCMKISSDGLNLFATSFGDSTLAVFFRDPFGFPGCIEILRKGLNGVNLPRFTYDIAISPDDKYVYVCGIDSDVEAPPITSLISIFRRDEPIDSLIFIKSLQPVDSEMLLHIAMAPDGKYVYINDWINNSLLVFKRDESDGDLTLIEKYENLTNNVQGLSNLTSLEVSADNSHIYLTSDAEHSIAFFERDISSPSVSIIDIPDSVLYRNDFNVEVIAEDNFQVKNVLLNYREGGSHSYQSIPMNYKTGNVYSVVFPKGNVTEKGLQVYVIAEDGTGFRDSTQIRTITVSFEKEIQSVLVSKGKKQNDYMMFSCPNNLEATNLVSILEPIFSKPDNTKWGVFRYQNGAYAEYPNVDSVVPGNAFWIFSTESHRIEFGKGHSLNPGESYYLKLSNGWHQVGNPFAFTIDWDEISVEDGDSSDINGPWEWINGSYELSDIIEPYKGYFIKNMNSGGDITLRIPPKESELSNRKLNKFINKSNSHSIRIIATCGKAKDVFNYIGVSSIALKEWDKMDYVEPPPFGNYISLYFPHYEWDKYPDIYSTDFRPPFDDGAVWEMELKTNLDDIVNLYFEGIETFPQNSEVWIKDELLNITQNLRITNQFLSAVIGPENPKKFKLIIGNKNFIEDTILKNQLIPSNYKLYQNFPNPFNPVTTIRYALPKSERVTLKIYNLLGKEVITLVKNEQKAKGYHVALWDGRDEEGLRVSNGIYFYKLQTNSFTDRKKMILTK